MCDNIYSSKYPYSHITVEPLYNPDTFGAAMIKTGALISGGQFVQFCVARIYHGIIEMSHFRDVLILYSVCAPSLLDLSELKAL